MSKPESFILNTDYPTIKNDNKGTVNITVPASITIAANSYWQLKTDFVIGTKGSVIRSTILSSLDNKEYIARNLAEYRKASSPANFGYYTLVDVYRKNPTTMTISVYIPNIMYPPASFTTSSIPETLTIKLATFLSPFN